MENKITNTMGRKNESLLRKNKVRLSESQLRRIIKQCINEADSKIDKESIIKDPREVPEVHFCNSYYTTNYIKRERIFRVQMLCEYGEHIVAGTFDLDPYTNNLMWCGRFEAAPYNIDTKTANEKQRYKLSQENSEYLAREIIRTGQMSPKKDMRWWRQTNGIFYMIPR